MRRDVGVNTLSGFNPDERDINWSLILAYRYWVLEPYVVSEVFHCSPTEYLGTNVWVPGAGVNVYLRPNVILKGAWFGPHFFKDNDPDKLATRRNFNTYSAILTWAF